MVNGIMGNIIKQVSGKKTGKERNGINSPEYKVEADIEAKRKWNTYSRRHHEPP